MAVRVFLSYAHEDEGYRLMLEKSLRQIQRQGLVEVWHDRKIGAGEEWAGRINAELDAADLVLLLVSPDFIASDYCTDVEVARALARHDKGEAVVVPVILRHCTWEWAPFARLQALPKDGPPWDQDPTGTEALLVELSALPSVALVVSIRRAEQPGRVAWSPRVRVQPLGEADAVDVFCGIAGEEHRRAPGLRPLLAKLAGVPLAITLLAHAAEGNDLNNLAEEWEARRTALLQRGGGRDRETSWEASLELSLRSRRMTEEGRRLAALMGVLPDGVAQQDLRALLGDAGPGAARVLAQLELAYFEAGRLRMLPPVREHLAGARLPAAEDIARAMEHYRELAETLGPRAGRPGGAETVARLAPEVANLDAVIRRGLEGGDITRWIDAAVALTDFVRFSGHVTPSPLEPALAEATVVGDIRRRAECTLSLGIIALDRSEHERARGMYEKALPLYREAGDVLGEANCMQSLGDIELRRSEHEQARGMYEKALPLYRKVGAVLGMANCIYRLGEIALARSEHEQARGMYEKAQPMYRQVGSVLGEADCIRSLGDIARAQGDIHRARSCYEAALTLYARIPEPCSMGLTYRRLARLATDSASRGAHLAAARSAWLSIDRPDLVADLDRDYPPDPPAA